MFPLYPVKSCVCFLFCIRGWCKNQSLFFEEKAIFLGKQGGLKDYVCSEEIDFHEEFVLHV